jgi:alpha-1,6-mannosyltransferase
MHVVDVSMFWAPGSGGVRTYLQAKHQWLSRQPCVDHTLLVPGAEPGCQAGVCTLPAPLMPLGHGYRFPLRKRAWVERLVQLHPDVIEVGDPYVLPWAALHAGRELDVPVIGFYHSDLPRLVSRRAGHWTNRWLDGYVSMLYQRFDRVLAPSRIIAEKLRRLGVERVSVQPLGVDASKFNPRWRDPGVRLELGVDERTHLLVFAGRGSREKNIPVLLQTMQRLGPRFHLHLVGTYMPEHIPDNVSCASGFVDQNRLARLLASSDALVHAGDCETFGLVVLEAMASGLPVVGVNGGAVPELIAPGTGLVAEPRSADSLAGQVEVLFCEDRREMGRLARRHVETSYDWAKVLPRLLDHYRELAYGENAWSGVVNA